MPMANPLRRVFLAHPASVGESYPQHFGIAARFGVTMIASGLGCLVHALVPALFVRTGSTAVKRLYGEMAARQPDLATPHLEPEWQLEYEI